MNVCNKNPECTGITWYENGVVGARLGRCFPVKARNCGGNRAVRGSDNSKGRDDVSCYVRDTCGQKGQ